MTRRRIAEVVQGMALVRAKYHDDTMRLPLEPLKNGDVIVRLRLTGLNAETVQALKSAFANGGTPWLVVDRSGAVVHLYRNAVNGRGIESLSMSRVLETLPDAEELPDEFRWTDFTKQQLTALMLMSDITSQLTREQIGATCGVDKVTLWRWEGKGKFLKAKAWLIERARHRLEEDFYRNVGTGQYSPDDAVRIQYTKMVGEACGKLGRRPAEAQDIGKAESDLAASLSAMTPAVRELLGNELMLLANNLTGRGRVVADADGRLRAGPESSESRVQNPESRIGDGDGRKAECRVQSSEPGVQNPEGRVGDGEGGRRTDEGRGERREARSEKCGADARQSAKCKMQNAECGAEAEGDGNE
jgi:hypothetical protein